MAREQTLTMISSLRALDLIVPIVMDGGILISAASAANSTDLPVISMETSRHYACTEMTTKVRIIRNIWLAE